MNWSTTTTSWTTETNGASTSITTRRAASVMRRRRGAGKFPAPLHLDSMYSFKSLKYCVPSFHLMSFRLDGEDEEDLCAILEKPVDTHTHTQLTSLLSELSYVASVTHPWVISLFWIVFRFILYQGSNNDSNMTLSSYSHLPPPSFFCSSCDRSWSSARVTVLFRYRLRGSRGTVLMRPFGQACRICDTNFILPGFSEAEVRGSLLRLFHKIRKNCYGDVDDDDVDDGDSQRNTRHTKPHEAALCEACSQGICTQKENDD